MDSIPTFVRNLRSLSDVLDGVGRISSMMTRLTKLTHVELSSIDLIGTLPTELDSLTRRQGLYSCLQTQLLNGKWCANKFLGLRRHWYVPIEEAHP